MSVHTNLIDPLRNVAVWSWDIASEVFGNSVPNEDPDLDGKKVVLDMRYPGQRYDAPTGLFYNYYRDMGPATGRYVQSDPIGLTGGISTYGYVESNPLNAVDPLGLQAVRPPRATTSQGSSSLYTGPVRGLIREIQLYNPSFRYSTIGPRGHSYNQNDVAQLSRVLNQTRTDYQARYPNSCPAGAGGHLVRTRLHLRLRSHVTVQDRARATMCLQTKI